MSENQASGKESKEPSSGGAFAYRGIRIFGLDLQDAIHYFFGGNASLAIIMLALICLLLLKEAFMFFPDHHDDATKYRRSGQELADYVRAEVDTHTQIYSNTNVAYFAERNASSLEEDAVIAAYKAVQRNVEGVLEDEWEDLEDKADELEDLQDDREDLGDDPEKAAERAELSASISALEREVAEGQEELRSLAEKALGSSQVWDIGTSNLKLTKERRELIKKGVLHLVPGVEDEHPEIAEIEERSAQKKAEATERLADFKATVDGMREAVKPIKDLFYEMRAIASENKKELVAFDTAHARRAALLEAAKGAATDEEAAEYRERAEAVDIVEPDYDALNVPLYEKIPTHESLVPAFQAEMARLVAKLPQKEVAIESAADNLKKATRAHAKLEAVIAQNAKRIPNWKHDRPVSWPASIGSFFFGPDWVTNSSWHEFYGLMPLFLGSLLIAIVAIAVSVPFSVSAAIYVNQLAPFKEQSLVKPAIEFIEAIPSVVLGLFGVLVFGETLRSISQVEWLSWIPGFPMAERLNILNAGLLLALMAVPTIFTLAEDALNNVPQAFTENSLAMGASKLQTVIRVVVPCALSGIIAAVLLGFGRIIGETMVVLLVAGNKIKVPDFSEGIGVIMQPAHTMTGIIAQELGEVDNGSLHWRALFMVGMVLFVISLLVNFSAQQILKRFQKF